MNPPHGINIILFEVGSKALVAPKEGARNLERQLTYEGEMDTRENCGDVEWRNSKF